MGGEGATGSGVQMEVREGSNQRQEIRKAQEEADHRDCRCYGTPETEIRVQRYGQDLY